MISLPRRDGQCLSKDEAEAGEGIFCLDDSDGKEYLTYFVSYAMHG